MLKKAKRLLILFFVAVVAVVLASYFILDSVVPKIYVESPSYIERLEKNAMAGDANAMFLMGNNHYYGHHGLEVDYEEALQWYRLAAKNGDAGAMNSIGLMYKEGVGVEKKYEKAVSLFVEAVELGDPKAQINLGNMYARGIHVQKDYKKSFNLFLKSAEQNDPQAMYEVGFHFLKGQGVDQDAEKAFKWFLEAAEQGHVASQYALGNAYSAGEGVEKDIKSGCEWFEKAANKGDIYAQYAIAGCYFNGSGQFKKDYFKSGYWYDLASKNGDESAKKFLDESDKYCSPSGIITESSLPYCVVAASAGYVDSQTHVAAMYHSGDIMEQNYIESFKWLLKSAEQGSIRSQALLAKSYGKGLGVEKNDVEQFVWLYVVAHSSPNTDIELMIVKMAKFALLGLESKKDHETITAAERRAQKYLENVGEK